MKTDSLRPYLVLFLTLFTLWVLLTASLSMDELLTGAIISLAATLVSGQIHLFDTLKISITTPLAIVRYLMHFFTALIKANIDLAMRVLSPSLPINPAIVEVETELKSDLAKLLLANSITLTPGTLTVDIIDDRLLIHWVDATTGKDLVHATQTIAAGFERHIKGFMQ